MDTYENTGSEGLSRSGTWNILSNVC